MEREYDETAPENEKFFWSHKTPGPKKAGRVFHAQIGQTKAGNPKLFWAEASNPEEKEILVVFKTYGGYRGRCAHKGDEGESGLLPFPGKIIVEGNTAEGMAGRAGCHEQIIAAVPKGVVFSTHYFGRKYGNPTEHFYMYQDRKIIVLTKQEREVSEIF